MIGLKRKKTPPRGIIGVRGPIRGGPIGGTRGRGGTLPAWILATGFWNDSGVFRNDSVWID